MKLHNLVLSVFTFNLIMISNQEVFSQPEKLKIYAAVLSNKSYTVGAKNQGVGLFVGDEHGEKWENIAFKNMRTFAIEIFPEHGGGLFYAACGNGVFVSRNGGNSWRVTTTWEITEIIEAAAISSNPKTIYIGTAYGLWKSSEYGENWQRLTNRFVAGLNLDISDPNRIYLGEEDGLLISKDGGKTFEKANTISDAVNQIVQDPDDTGRIYVGTEEHGIYLSDNRGESFRQVGGPAGKTTIYSIVVDHNNPQRVFAGTFGSGVLKSTDRGASWQVVTNGLQDIAIYEVAIHPLQPNILYAGTVNRGIFRSEDSGLSWQPFALDGTHVLELEIK